jgi:hypothetical protein
MRREHPRQSLPSPVHGFWQCLVGDLDAREWTARGVAIGLSKVARRIGG